MNLIFARIRGCLSIQLNQFLSNVTKFPLGVCSDAKKHCSHLGYYFYNIAMPILEKLKGIQISPRLGDVSTLVIIIPRQSKTNRIVTHFFLCLCSLFCPILCIKLAVQNIPLFLLVAGSAVKRVDCVAVHMLKM